MFEKEKIIKEQRLAEAIDKNYMGLEGKFGIILKYLGHPITTSHSCFDYTPFSDVYELDNEEGLPEEDPYIDIREIGRMFDGLKFGYHIEISYLKEGTIPVKENEYLTNYEPALKVIKVSYKGYLMYLEAQSELYLFRPMPEWEDLISKIYESAQKIQSKNKPINKMEIAERGKKEKLNFLERLREKWGI